MPRYTVEFSKTKRTFWQWLRKDVVGVYDLFDNKLGEYIFQYVDKDSALQACAIKNAENVAPKYCVFKDGNDRFFICYLHRGYGCDFKDDAKVRYKKMDHTDMDYTDDAIDKTDKGKANLKATAADKSPIIRHYPLPYNYRKGADVSQIDELCEHVELIQALDKEITEERLQVAEAVKRTTKGTRVYCVEDPLTT